MRFGTGAGRKMVTVSGKILEVILTQMPTIHILLLKNAIHAVLSKANTSVFLRSRGKLVLTEGSSTPIRPSKVAFGYLEGLVTGEEALPNFLTHAFLDRSSQSVPASGWTCQLAPNMKSA